MTSTTEPRLRFSVIVVSHNRPRWLARCLKALRQLDHGAFEIVVVADQASMDVLQGDDFKRRPFDKPNISEARNLGISAAAGDICAFVDDDSVPEPLWLQHLEAAFFATQSDAVVGFVRGRNGISFQSRLASVDVEGETHEERVPEATTPFVPTLKNGPAVKLVGTNAAFRRDVLLGLKGFDPAYAFYLDDTDISLRLARAGMTAAVAPLAEVHHAFAASRRRTNLRAPTYLGDIGRSAAVFLRRHQGISKEELLARVIARERARLIRHLVQGTCEPRDFNGLLAGLHDGWEAGLTAELPTLPELMDEKSEFQRLTPLKGHSVLASRLLLRHKTLAKASKLAESGHRVSLFSFSLTPVRHLVRYSDSGVWVQTGGQFGRAIRDHSIFKWCRFAERKKIEIRRVAKQRGI